MTFLKLHAQIKPGCDCLGFGPIPPPPDHTFYRWGANTPAIDYDFWSRYERGQKLSGNGCKDHCHYRGVSVVQIEDLARKKIELKAAYQIRQNPDERYIYFIHIRTQAGLVWYQEGNPHCELFKDDNFVLEDHIDFIETFDRVGPI